MNDLIARIGLALRHLSDNSTVNGPARQEIERLTAELQSVETSISDIVAREVTRQMEGVEGRMVAHLDGNLEQLASDLEASNIEFTPVPAVRIFPPAVAEVVETPQEPAPTTGNIPAPVDETPASPPVEEPVAVVGEPIVEGPAVEPGTPPTGDADQTGAGSKIADQDPPAADTVALQTGDPTAPNTPAADPEPVSTVVAGTAPDEVVAPVEEPAADPLTMVQGGGSDVIG